MHTRIFGHRGAPCARPENTLAGFAYALDAGVDGLELDLLMTRDGVPVVTHNPTLWKDTTRSADGAWLETDGPAIFDLTLQDLQTYDVGGIRPGTEYAQKFPDQVTVPKAQVPTLRELLELVKRHPRRIDLLVELKHMPGAENQPEAEAFVAAVLAELRRAGLMETSYIHAFNWAILHAARQIAPELRRSYLSFERRETRKGTLFSGSPWLAGLDVDRAPLPALLHEDGAAAWSPHWSDVTAQHQALCDDLDLELLVWTVNEAAQIRHWLDQGVSGLITDDPDLALALRHGEIAKDAVFS